MAMSWIDNIKDTGKLTVYDELTGKWKNIFHQALESFKTLGLSVKIEKTKNKEQVNILMRSADLAATYNDGKDSYTKPFSGTGLHGYTMLLSRDNKVEKAIVFLPSRPQTSAGYIKGKLVTEDVGTDVMLGIAVHELVHACGLENADHGDDGIFYFPLGVSGNKLIVPEKGKNNRPMPPIFLSSSTIGKVQALWKK